MNNNKFLEMTICYNRVPELDYIDIESTLEELRYYRENCNGFIYDMIDYPRLIFLELKFRDCEQVQKEIAYLKEIINENYIKNKKLINRFKPKY